MRWVYHKLRSGSTDSKMAAHQRGVSSVVAGPQLLGVSKNSAHAILSEDLNMNRVVAKFVPKLLSPEQKDLLFEVALDLLDTAITHPGFLNTVITGDESWVYGFNPET
ncbi:HTH_48 domain-containing protein [Nephila pilipes]|uniref:HTH_48 domain-containing protein n=1 Tax=Nephila pilipes TaxID=299642 RepID=A0A8X6QKT4_NEPPI|nr:HTH_48 domain-containing protein [Nephila pilipes]